MLLFSILKLVVMKQKKSVKGFTLVETLVSTMIITVVILGPMTVANNASTYARQTKDTMTAIYLAQEAIELLRHQQDSLYLRCLGQTNTSCTLLNSELPKEAAWRIFRERLGNNTQGASCFSIDNASGCAYDFIDMTSNDNGDFNPPKYSGISSSCKGLSISGDHTYVCTGVHGTGVGYTPTLFSRFIFVTSIQTFPETGEIYNDDLRVTVIVSFRRANGYMKQIKVVDFLHARA